MLQVSASRQEQTWGLLPYICGLSKYLGSQRVCFFSRVGQKYDITFGHFGLNRLMVLGSWLQPPPDFRRSIPTRGNTL